MNMSAISIPMSPSAIYGSDTGVGMILLSKVLDQAENTQDMMTKMVQSAGIPGLGEHIDVWA